MLTYASARRLLATLLMLLSLSLNSVVAAQAFNANFSELQNMARLANAAYLNGDALKAELDKQRLNLQKQINVSGYAVSGFVAVDAVAKKQFIVVRGTSNIENAYVDIALQLMPDKKSGIKLHQGFLQSASNFYQAVLPVLRRDYQVVTVGHSLGGAVANILAMYLDKDGFQFDKAVTFGQPKITNVGGAQQYADLNIIRVVTPKDVVPLLPPLDPMDLMKLDIYWHMGVEVVLLETNEYALLSGQESMMRVGRFINVAPNERNLQHHMMSEYLQRLSLKQNKAKQVAYPSQFNMFGGMY